MAGMVASLAMISHHAGLRCHTALDGGCRTSWFVDHQRKRRRSPTNSELARTFPIGSAICCTCVARCWSARLPGWLVEHHARATAPNRHVVHVVSAACAVLLCQLIVLSQLDINSVWRVLPAGFLPARTLPVRWLIFYVETAMIVALASAAAALAVVWNHASAHAAAALRGRDLALRPPAGRLGWLLRNEPPRKRSEVAVGACGAQISGSTARRFETSEAVAGACLRLRVQRGCCVGSTNRSGCGIRPNTRPRRVADAGHVAHRSRWDYRGRGRRREGLRNED